MPLFHVYQTYTDTEVLTVEASDEEDATAVASRSTEDWVSVGPVEFQSMRVEVAE